MGGGCERDIMNVILRPGMERNTVRKSVKKRRRGYSSIWSRTPYMDAIKQEEKAEKEQVNKVVIPRRKSVRRKNSVVSKKGKERRWARRRSLTARRGREEQEEQLDSWLLPGEQGEHEEKGPGKYGSVGRKVTRRATFLMKKYVKKSQSMETQKQLAVPVSRSLLSKSLIVRRASFLTPARWSQYLGQGKRGQQVDTLPRVQGVWWDRMAKG